MEPGLLLYERGKRRCAGASPKSIYNKKIPEQVLEDFVWNYNPFVCKPALYSATPCPVHSANARKNDVTS